MANPKATTIRQRFGFRDDDLRKPDHDTIMVWLDRNAADVYEAVYGYGWRERWSKDQADDFSRIRALLSEMRLTTDPPGGLGKPEYIRRATLKCVDYIKDSYAGGGGRLLHSVWEHTVRNDRGFEVGFIDLLATFSYPTASVDLHGWKLELDPREIDDNTFEPAEMVTVLASEIVGFEVKTTTPSIGELIRQLRLYDPFVNEICVVSPDTRARDTLLSQGYGFYDTNLPAREQGITHRDGRQVHLRQLKTNNEKENTP